MYLFQIKQLFIAFNNYVYIRNYNLVKVLKETKINILMNLNIEFNDLE